MTERISMVALGPENDEERSEWLEALARTIDRRAFCLGAEVNDFEQQVREQLGVRHALGVSNGSDALRIALQAAGVSHGDEVVVPAFSFFASASSIAQLGARPRFVDVEPETLTLDVGAVEGVLNERTRAVMPVHLYGQSTQRFGDLIDLCRTRGLPIIEDAAQAFGVKYRGDALGGAGSGDGIPGAGTFSFYPTKNLAAPGDAGMIITNDDATADCLRKLRVHGDRGGYDHELIGWNARMDGFSAAVLAIRLRRLPAIQEKRAANAARYLESIAESGIAEQVRPLGRTEDSEHCWHQFIVRVPDRDRIRAALSEQGIDTGVYYPSTLPAQPAFAHFGDDLADFPVAEAAARDALALPIHHRLGPDDPQRVVQAIARAFA